MDSASVGVGCGSAHTGTSTRTLEPGQKPGAWLLVVWMSVSQQSGRGLASLLYEPQQDRTIADTRGGDKLNITVFVENKQTL